MGRSTCKQIIYKSAASPAKEYANPNTLAPSAPKSLLQIAGTNVKCPPSQQKVTATQIKNNGLLLTI